MAGFMAFLTIFLTVIQFAILIYLFIGVRRLLREQHLQSLKIDELATILKINKSN